ncbi:inositol monophosphatase family protein [Actinocorallia populi]|uniref:inositol monophosphatase family protein n=1 Tax=Actinocorallia populi TaxID=2079200 RepID=UPI000D095DF6|nr:inositol monophosphatase family protein [Actinocorallia populi]
MTDSMASLLPVALEAAALAHDLILTRVPGAVTAKGDRDMASEVDYAVERAVRDHLRELTPSIAFLGEEEGRTGPAESGLTWIADPVDGTANFVHGIPLCGFSLGLARDDTPVLGVIDLPFLGARYFAAQGAGAYLGDRRIRASTATSLTDAIVAIGDYAVGPDADNARRLALTGLLASRVQRVRMLGSAALDLAWAAEGRLDASLTLSNNPWDMTAGAAIAREAGAGVHDARGAPYTLAADSIIVTAPGLTAQVRELLAEAPPPA